MTTYELRVHSRDVKINENLGSIGKHTGYDLIITDDNGKKTIQSIDLYNNNEKINFNFLSCSAENYLLENGSHIIWGTQTFQNNQVKNTTSQYLNDYSAEAKIILSGNNALEAFQKIKLNATILNLYSDSLTYDILKRNCNTSTQYFSDLYLNGQDVFNDLPGHYLGKDSNFNDYILDDGQPVGLTNYYIDMSSSLAEAIYNGMPEGFDMNNINIEKLENGELFISNGTQGYETKFYPKTTSIYNNKDAMFIMTGNDSTSVSSFASNVIITSKSGNDFIGINGNHNKITSGSGIDEINIVGNNNTVNSGTSDDIIHVKGDNNKIYGESGNDSIDIGSTTKANNCIVDGGTGNDTINLHGDNNIIEWNVGGGFDTIRTSRLATVNTGNRLRFGKGISFEDIIYQYANGQYQAMHLDENGNIDGGVLLANEIKSVEYEEEKRTKNIDDGLVLTQNNVAEKIIGTKGDDIIIGNGGNDIIEGGDGDDLYVWNLGNGLDTITDDKGINRIKFGEGISQQDIKIYAIGNNNAKIVVKDDPAQGIIMTNFLSGYPEYRFKEIIFDNGDVMDLTNTGAIFTKEVLNSGFASSYDDIFYGTAADDGVHGVAGNDVLYGNEGNDSLRGGNGNDEIYGGNGDDHIEGNENDDVLFGDNGNDYISGGNGNDEIHGGAGDDYIEGNEDDDILFGDDGNDYIAGGSGNDILSGGKGNDDLFGDEGDDTYIWNLGDGLDTIQDSWGKSIIQFGEGISPADVTIRSNDGAVELLVNNDVTQGIRISTRYDLQRDESPYEVHFKDGTIMNLTNVGLTFTQTDEAEKITGTDFDDIIYANGGNDTVHAGSGNDIIYGGDGNDNLYGEEGSDTIHGGAGDDWIVSDLDNAKDENWTHELYGDEGNDYLQGSIGKDILVGGTGDDTLQGRAGDDTYIYNLGDGFDTIIEDGGNDTIVFGEGITLEDLTFRKSGTDLIININGDSSQGINIFNHALMRNDSLTEYNVESIRFADGSTLDISNADQLIQAMNSFSVSNSASTDTLSNPTEDVCDMYSLAASQDLTRKAI